MTFELTVLGSSSASPAYQRNPTSQLLNLHERFYLIDCGEGTQVQLMKYKLRFHRINHIFISHLHGDHYLGLMGLLSTLHLQGRTNELHLFCHKELEEIIELQLKVSETVLRFPLTYHFHKTEDGIVFQDDDISVETITLNHRIPCKGFVFREKAKLRNIAKEKIRNYKIPVSAFRALKNGKDFVDENGLVIKNEELTSEPKVPRSYAYCSDTMYDERILDKIKGVDLLYHESTFMHDMLERANETFHTTSLQAAQMAEKSNCKTLLIGHFSARYRDLNPLLEEAKAVFENSFLAIEGQKFTVEISG